MICKKYCSSLSVKLLAFDKKYHLSAAICGGGGEAEILSFEEESVALKLNR